MPNERREIIFLPDELGFAVAAFCRMSNGAFPVGRIVTVTPKQAQSGPGIEVGINPPNCGDQVVTARIEGAAFTEMLIRFCIENNISIPRAGRKLVRIAAGAVSLLIVIDRHTS